MRFFLHIPSRVRIINENVEWQGTPAAFLALEPGYPGLPPDRVVRYQTDDLHYTADAAGQHYADAVDCLSYCANVSNYPGAGVPAVPEYALSTHNHDSSYAALAHTHSHTALTDIGSNSHAQIDTHIADTSIHGSGATIPAGTIWAFAGAAAPAGWLLCDGAAVSRSTYSALFAVIGTTYGAGDGSTTFAVPDAKGRSLLGAGQGSGLTNRTLGAKLGEEAHNNTLAQNGEHAHGFAYSVPANASTHGATAGSGGYWGGTYLTTTTTSGSGSAHNTMQPNIVVNFIIKT